MVEAIVIAGGIFLGRLIARTLRGRSSREGSAARPTEKDDLETPDPFVGFPCKLGDVVVRRFEGDEAWLAGALVLAEDRPVAALFIAPDAQGERAVFVRAASPMLTWLLPLAAGQVAVAGEPPSTIEHAGARFRRTRRMPVRVERVGTGAPDVGGRAIVGEYTGSGQAQIVVVIGSDGSLAWRGVSLSEGQYDVLPGGQATLQA